MSDFIVMRLESNDEYQQKMVAMPGLEPGTPAL